MRGEWREVAVEEIKAQSENALATGPFGSSIGSRFFEDSGVPVIRGSNLSEDIGTRLNDHGLVFLSPDKAREFSRSTVRDGDLVFTCWGTVNQVGLIDRRTMYREYIISNKQMKLTPDPAKTDSLFLYYLFSGPELQHRIKNQSIGSSVPGFNLGQLRAMRIRIPEVEEQRAIAHILGTLDDKIELNRRMNETLEVMARALFKSWFVDFDPVHAKAKGRPPYLAPDFWSLFPAAIDDDDKPLGWENGALEDVAEIIMGASPDGSTYNTNGVGVPLVNGPVEYGDFFLRRIKWTTSPSKLSKYGDLILCVRGSTTGRHAFADGEYCLGRGVAAIRSKDNQQEFIDCAVLGYLDELLQHTTGSVFPNLSSADIRGLRIIVPNIHVRRTFSELIRPLRKQKWANVQEAETLATLRDTLLPKLISGELRVKDAEHTLTDTQV